MAVVLDHVLPSNQEPRRVPATIRECSPGMSYGCSGETTVDEAREDGAAALEQAIAEPHPQEGEEAEATTRAKEVWIRYRRGDIR